LEQHSIGSIDVSVILGRFDDSDLELVVKSQDIPLGITPGGVIGGGGTVGGFGITIKEASDAENVIHWPAISMDNPDRRDAIYNATIDALNSAEKIEATKIGFFTMGLEVSRIPSWEIAEEIIKAINDYSKEVTLLDKIMLVASSPTQVSSFQYALNNISIISGK
jgi:O-acetyl-ADP-ribose deacetylase (regulator of RNase III)